MHSFASKMLGLGVLLALWGGGHSFGQADGWSLAWSDEFDGVAGAAPDARWWGFDYGLPPDKGQAYDCGLGQATDGCDPKEPNVSLDGAGHLVLEARRAAGAPNGVTTGRIRTTAGTETSRVLYSTKYGRVEARMWLPKGGGQQGVWPAFWMLGTNIGEVGWPASGEIDVMEYIGAKNLTQIYGTLHGPGYKGMGIGVRATRAAGWGGWHTYGVLWSPDEVKFYVDDPGKVYGTVTKAEVLASKPQEGTGVPKWPFDQPFYIILDLNMGGPFPGNVDATTTYPQRVLVDWVRVYRART